MDLPDQAARLSLDVAAIAVCATLRKAEVPHVVLKGPSTALWLYDPPRTYRDIDVLVPRMAIDRAVAALGEAGVATPTAGGVGEEAPHSLLMKTSSGHELDLHISLPTLPIASDNRLWEALTPHIEKWRLDVGELPVLDESGRCLVIALHALGAGRGSGQPEDDLVRARRRADARAWVAAEGIAAEVGATDLLTGALAMIDDNGSILSARAQLFASGAAAASLGLDRLVNARRRDLCRMLVKELLPSWGFMRHDVALRGRPLARRNIVLAYFQRWGRLLHALPGAVTQVRAARLKARPPRVKHR